VLAWKDEPRDTGFGILQKTPAEKNFNFFKIFLAHRKFCDLLGLVLGGTVGRHNTRCGGLQLLR